MINFLIACDHKDPLLGNFLNEAFLILCDKCNLLNDSFNAQIVDSDSFKQYSIESKIKLFNSHPFIFLALAHGNKDVIFIKDEEIIGINNSSIFKDSFFYAVSCSTAINLGDSLIDNGCCTYIGYAAALSIAMSHEDVFRDCLSYGIEVFLNENDSSINSFNKMKDKYTAEIDKMYKIDVFSASYLLANREALEIKGDSNSSLSDFIV